MRTYKDFMRALCLYIISKHLWSKMKLVATDQTCVFIIVVLNLIQKLAPKFCSQSNFILPNSICSTCNIVAYFLCFYTTPSLIFYKQEYYIFSSSDKKNICAKQSYIMSPYSLKRLFPEHLPISTIFNQKESLRKSRRFQDVSLVDCSLDYIISIKSFYEEWYFRVVFRNWTILNDHYKVKIMSYF